jgi:hypothetical protein
MRVAVVIVTLGALGGVLSGCAQQNQTVIVKPGPDESPRLEELEPPAHALKVKVPGRDERPLVTLTPDFREPELTPAEREALGQDPTPYKPLLFALPFRAAGQPVGNFYAGQSVAVSGQGGSAGAVGFTPQAYKLGPFGGQAVGTLSRTPPSAGLEGMRTGAERLGPWSQQDVAAEEASRQARKMLRDDR